MRITYTHRPSSGLGRFGGGWNWKVGTQVGVRTLILSLLVAELRIEREKSTMSKKEKKSFHWSCQWTKGWYIFSTTRVGLTRYYNIGRISIGVARW